MTGIWNAEAKQSRFICASLHTSKTTALHQSRRAPPSGVLECLVSMRARTRRRPRPPSTVGSDRFASTAHNHDTYHQPPFCCGNPNCEHQQSHEDDSSGKHDHPQSHTEDLPPCWACGKPTGCCNFFCACGKIQPLIGHCSYFETFGLPKVYDLDVKQLEQTFFNLQKTMHPDRYGQKSSTEQDFSRSNSTYLNVAYRTLKDPISRAKYLLQLEGVKALDERSKTADPALLMEVMELREEVEESGSAENLRALMARNQRAMEGVKEELTARCRQKVRSVQLSCDIFVLSLDGGQLMASRLGASSFCSRGATF